MALPSCYKLVWIGPDQPACEHLLERFRVTCSALGVTPSIVRASDIVWEQIAKADRLVLVAPSRAEYPARLVEALNSSPNIIPWGVVTTSWHVGSRRSGDGVAWHWQQPWFRWWDAWFGWFFPEVVRPAGRIEASHRPVIAPVELAQGAHSLARPMSEHSVAIVCACKATAQMLASQAHQVGWRSHVYRSFDHLLDATEPQTANSHDALLWDDSVLSCLPNTASSELMLEQLSKLTIYCNARAARTSSIPRIVASLDLEHLDLWPLIASRGHEDILVKPSFNLGFANYLQCQSAWAEIG